MKLIDLTHTLTPEIPTWYGNCGFYIEITKNYENEGEVKFCNQKLTLEAGVGTHMDAPVHCIPGSLSIADLPLDVLISPGVMIDISEKAHENYSLTLQDILSFEESHGKIPAGAFVMVYTGWSRHWLTPESYRNEYRFPSISKEAAVFLLKRGVNGLGIDTLSPDRPESGYPVHQLLLAKGKYIIENIANAHLLPPLGSQIFALPLKIAGATEAPMRLIAIIPEVGKEL